MKGSVRAPRTAGGTWAYRLDLGLGPGGRRAQQQAAGFASREEAEGALAEVLAAQGGGDPKTVAGFLERVWLPAKRAEVERSTFDQYAESRSDADLVFATQTGGMVTPEGLRRMAPVTSRT